MQDHIAKYLDHIRADYAGWSTNGTMKDEFCNGLSVVDGKKYLKVVSTRPGNKSVHSFICKEDDGKFVRGDVLKAAGWSVPAKNFARANIFTGEGFAERVRWTGCC